MSGHYINRWPTESLVSIVPDITHSSPAPRLAQKEMLQFEKMLEVTDATTATVFEARKRRKRDAADSPCAIGPPQAARVSLSLGESDDDEEDGVAPQEAIAQALVKTIAATTGVPAPESLRTTHSAITWASQSILAAREAAITSTRRERYNHVLDPEQTVQAMSLVAKLNALLEEPARGDQSL